jgi:hypothetical protein
MDFSQLILRWDEKFPVFSKYRESGVRFIGGGFQKSSGSKL